MAEIKASTLRSGANGRRFDPKAGETGSPHTVICPVCLKEASPSRSGSKRKFCSGKCRTLAWAVRAIAEALHDGVADGLRLRLVELGRMAISVKAEEHDRQGC